MALPTEHSRTLSRSHLSTWPPISLSGWITIMNYIFCLLLAVISISWNFLLLLWMAVDLLSETRSRNSPEHFNSPRNSSCSAAIVKVRKYHALLFFSNELVICMTVLLEECPVSPTAFFLVYLFPFQLWFSFWFWVLLSLICSKMYWEHILGMWICLWLCVSYSIFSTVPVS